MSIETFQLVEEFGEAILAGNAALFVGAGVSQGAGLPGWGGLLEPIRAACNVPEHHDYPLLAEYIVNELPGGRGPLEDHILTEITGGPLKPALAHRLIARLSAREVWTTNYDPLIEKAMTSADLDVAVAFDEDTIRAIASNHDRTVIKMHGSINASSNHWDAPPVITRTDFEQYEGNHPRLWTVLRASYLTRSILFLGFSFTDANVEILLRLARTLGTAGSDRHYAVMRRPASTAADDVKRLHELRVADLASSGVTVCEIDDHAQNTQILTQLLRRTRPSQVFISGSSGKAGATSEEEAVLLGPWASAVARPLSKETSWDIASLGGPAGWLTSRDVARLRRLDGTYDPRRLNFHFRESSDPPAALEERVGTAIYTDLDRDRLVASILDESRALLVIGGGSKTNEEIEWAIAREVGVVPLAASGGAALEYWESHRSDPPDLGGRPTNADLWKRLGDSDPESAAQAAYTLLRQAMYQQTK